MPLGEFDARAFDLDGVRLGDSVERMAAHPIYDTPCRREEIDGGRLALVYGATKCVPPFPEDTSAIFFVDEGQAIGAVAWVGGDYFRARSRTQFPISVGFEKEAASDRFKHPTALIAIGQDLWVWKFRGQICAVLEDAVIVGFVIGDMPEEGAAPEWKLVADLYRSMTPPVELIGGARVSNETCRSVLEKRTRLAGRPPPTRRELDQEIERCNETSTRAGIECALKAGALAELEACEKH